MDGAWLRFEAHQPTAVKGRLSKLWTPYTQMYHHESATRGADDSPEKQARFSSEVAYMHRRWGHFFSCGLYYNVNLTLSLPSFALAWPPRLDA